MFFTVSYQSIPSLLIHSKYLFVPVLGLVDPETEVAANHAKIVQIQNGLEDWLHSVQSRADLLGSEEFQDFLDLSRPGSVELRMSKHVWFNIT
jgi:hypothetical protein